MAVKLADLSPKWMGTADGRTGVGISFDCPKGRDCPGGTPGGLHKIRVPFANPIDGGAAFPQGNGCAWQRVGETFETLTLTPSIDGSHFGCWHGFVTNGEIT